MQISTSYFLGLLMAADHQAKRHDDFEASLTTQQRITCIDDPHPGFRTPTPPRDFQTEFHGQEELGCPFPGIQLWTCVRTDPHSISKTLDIRTWGVLTSTTSTSATSPSSILPNAGIARTTNVITAYWERRRGDRWSGTVCFPTMSFVIVSVIVGLELGLPEVEDRVLGLTKTLISGLRGWRLF